MIRTENPELTRRIIEHLASLYKIREKREGIHISTLTYCLTSSFLTYQQAAEPTDEEVLLFALGLGLQDVLTPKGAEPQVFELDGVTFSPDMQFSLPSYKRLVELKTTRRTARKHWSVEGIPETWLEYIKGGCFVRKEEEYDLSVLYLMGSYSPPFPVVISETIKFTEDELQENWQCMLQRKKVYERALEVNLPPKPQEWCKGWECEHCRYKLLCGVLIESGQYLKFE